MLLDLGSAANRLAISLEETAKWPSRPIVVAAAVATHLIWAGVRAFGRPACFPDGVVAASADVFLFFGVRGCFSLSPASAGAGLYSSCGSADSPRFCLRLRVALVPVLTSSISRSRSSTVPV